MTDMHSEDRTPDPAGGDGRRVALVTGAGRGIGAASARALAAAGCAVVAVDLDGPVDGLTYATSGAEELAAVVAACGPNALAVQADVRDDAALDGAVAAAVERFGGLDVVVAAAGVMAGGSPVWRTSNQVWDLNIDINLSGVWRTARATVPELLRRPAPRTGRFIAIASAAGMGGHPTIGAYCAAKHGVIGLVRGLAADLGASGVTANAVCPGSTDSGILRASAEIYGLGSVDEFSVHHPIGRILQPEEIARTVVWLADAGSGGITGAAVAVDGGMTI